MSRVAIQCVVFDFAFTLCSDYYCKVTPPECPDWFYQFQRRIYCRHSPYLDDWMTGKLTSSDIAQIMTQHLLMPAEKILAQMEEGCRHLELNSAVLAFAKTQREQGRKIALVTANMDIFTKIVVRAHRLDNLFDAIVNSADYGELRKDRLWPIAFERLGGGAGFQNSFLIEDGAEPPQRFRELGGQAYQYTTDDAFARWLADGGFDARSESIGQQVSSSGEPSGAQSIICYRNAMQADIPQMLALWRCFWKPQAYEANLPRKIASDADLAVVAECDGKVVGTIIGGWDGWWAWVYRVAVHPEYQRKGIAASLFKEIHQRLAARGADAACLFASPDNKPMRELLAKIGYNERHDQRFAFLLEAPKQ